MGHEDVDASLENLKKIGTVRFPMANSDLRLEVIRLESKLNTECELMKKGVFLEEKIAIYEIAEKLYEGGREAELDPFAMVRLRGVLMKAKNRLKIVNQDIKLLEAEEIDRRKYLEQQNRP